MYEFSDEHPPYPPRTDAFDLFDGEPPEAPYDAPHHEPPELLIGPPPEEFVPPVNAIQPVTEEIHPVGIAAAEEQAPQPNPAEFLQLLEDPDYQPPEYKHSPNSTVGFETAGLPPPAENTYRTILYPKTYAHPDGYLHTVHRDLAGHVRAVEMAGVTAYTQHLGSRGLAVDLQTPTSPEDTFRITAVYGVEPLYRGEPVGDRTHAPLELIIEGRVVETNPSASLPTIRSKNPVPAMRIELDPDDPTHTLWMPHEQAIDAQTGNPTLPLVGDTVQIRIESRIVTDPTLGPVGTPCGFVGFMDTPFVMTAGEARQLRAADRLRHTGIFIAALETTNEPLALGALTRRYFVERTATERSLQRYGIQETRRITVTPEEAARVLDALRTKKIPPGYLPAIVERVLSKDEGLSEQDLDRLQRLDTELHALGLYKEGESISSVTTARLGQLGEQLADHTLLAAERTSPGMMPTIKLRTILEMLDTDMRRTAGSRIVERMLDLPCHELFKPAACYVVSDLLQTAAVDRRYLVQLIAGAARTEEDVMNLATFDAFEGNNNRILTTFINTANDALEFSSPLKRQSNGISEQTYADMVATAHSVLRMVNMATARHVRLVGTEQAEILQRLRAHFDRTAT